MLCDDLVADELLPMAYDGLDRVYDKIRQAQKFILSPQFAIAADGLVDNIPELFKIAPWCRVPFPLTWIEWLASDRPHWDQDGPYKARPVDRSRFQFAPHRIGILLEQQGRASCWKTHLFWSMRTAETGQYNGSIAAIRFDAEACDNADDPLLAATRTVMADFGGRMIMRLLETNPEILGKLGQYALEDWGGEMRYMVSVLGLLNTRNVTESTTVDNTKVNVKRKRHGKRPLFSHNILKIRPSVCTGGTAAQTAGGHRDIRFHYVRGHFKQRASGLYWWSMHGRGRVDVGVVEKDYEVEA
jgi:hypothetical protein